MKILIVMSPGLYFTPVSNFLKTRGQLMIPYLLCIISRISEDIAEAPDVTALFNSWAHVTFINTLNILNIQHHDPCNPLSKFNRNPRCLINIRFWRKYRIASSSEAGVIRIFVQTMYIYIYHELITNVFPMKFKDFAANLTSNCQQQKIGNISNLPATADL